MVEHRVNWFADEQYHTPRVGETVWLQGQDPFSYEIAGGALVRVEPDTTKRLRDFFKPTLAEMLLPVIPVMEVEAALGEENGYVTQGIGCLALAVLATPVIIGGKLFGPVGVVGALALPWVVSYLGARAYELFGQETAIGQEILYAKEARRLKRKDRTVVDTLDTDFLEKLAQTDRGPEMKTYGILK